MEMKDTALHESNDIDVTGNAPMIPRRELIDVLNQIQLVQTKLLIILNRYEPEHFKETENRQPKVSETVWSQSTTGQPEQSMVHTVTGE